MKIATLLSRRIICFASVLGLISILFSDIATAQTLSDVSPQLLYLVTSSTPDTKAGDNTTNVTAITSGTADFCDLRVDNYVKVAFDPNINYAINVSVPTTYTVTLTVKKTFITGSTTTTTTTDYPFDLTYDPTNGVTYNDKVEYHFNDAYKVSAKVKSVKKNGTTVTLSNYNTLPQNIYFEVYWGVDRYYDFDPATPSTTLKLEYIDDPALSQNEQLRISGFAIDGATAYDIEWTYVNDYSNVNETTLLPDAEYVFHNNSSRIRVYSIQSIFLPATFDRGYIIARVRGIGRDPSDCTKEVTGVWSIEDNYDLRLPDKNKIGDISSSLADSWIHIGESPLEIPSHEPDKNWMFQATFAEGGKMKNTISYFDGSLRNRQVVTQMNTVGESMVSETFYDFNGRPAAQSLPAPVERSEATVPNRTMNYQEKFNLAYSTTTKYGREYFDEDGDACSPALTGFDDASGAGNYYSPSNPITNKFNSWIPDANDFPFTITQYTPDNTGRIAKQTGVGSNHNLISGHETTYYYSKPSQEELYRMFGDDIGIANHYKKNIIIDPNDQVSVSYLDLKGNVIATALAGAVSPQTDALPGEGGTGTAYLDNQNEYTIDILNINKDALHGSENSLINEDQTYTVNTSFTVTEPADYYFYYEAEEKQYFEDCINKCMECVYDLEISVKNSCGEEMLNTSDGLPFTIKLGETPEELTEECESPDIFKSSDDYDAIFSITDLPRGTYTISKTLSVNSEALQFYADKYMEEVKASECASTFADFYAAEELDFEELDCEIDCEYCETVRAFETVDEFILANATEIEPEDIGDIDPIEVIALTEVYNQLLDQCENVCANQGNDYCNVIYEMMLQDVSPGGQYAECYNEDGDIEESLFHLSVLNESNFLLERETGVHPDWKAPRLFDPSSGTFAEGYFNEEGTERTKITVILNDDGMTTTPLSEDHFSDGSGGYYTYPELLIELPVFITYFASNPSWAKSLLYYHPEFYQYEYCIKQYACTATVTDVLLEESTVNTFQYDDFLLHLSLADALTLGYLDFSSGSYAILDNDPIFATTDCADLDDYQWLKTVMEDRLNAYETCDVDDYNLFEFVWMMNHEGSEFDPGFDCSDIVIPTTTFFKDLITTEDDWQTFASLYMATKQEYIFQLANYYAHAEEKSFNICIGNSGFDPASEDFVAPFVLSDVFDDEQLCYWPRAIFLSEKIKRFNTSTDYYDVDESSDDALMEDLDEMLAESDLAYWESTGNYPIAGDIQLFLNGLLGFDGTGLLPDWKFDAIPIGDNLSLSKRMYDYLHAGAGIFSIDIEDWDPVGALGDELTWIYSSETILKLTLPSGSWSGLDIVEFRDIFVDNPATGHFTISVVTDDGDIISGIEGQSYMPVNDESFLIDALGCDLTPEANTMKMVLNYLFTQSTSFPDVPLSLTTLQSEALESVLEPYLGDITGVQTYEWTYVSGSPNIYKLKRSTGSAYLQFVFDVSFDASATVIVDFSSPDPGYPGAGVKYNDFAGLTDDGSGGIDPFSGHIEYYTGAATIDFPITDCKYPVEDECLDIEHFYQEDFAVLLEYLATNGILTPALPVDISATIDHEFSHRLLEFLGYDFDAPPTLFYSGVHPGMVNYVWNGVFNQDNDYFCGFTLQATFGNNLDDISTTSFTGFSLDPAGEIDDVTHAFSFLAPGDIIGPISGTTCIPMKYCKCDPEIAYLLPEDELQICDPVYAAYPEIPIENPCIKTLESLANYEAQLAYDAYLVQLEADFKANYIAHCMQQDVEDMVAFDPDLTMSTDDEDHFEKFTYTYTSSEYQYTLYYYDQGGNLYKTVPPIAVVLLTDSEIDDEIAYRAGVTGSVAKYPPHDDDFITTYRYNTLNQLVYQNTPDADESRFWYDRLGRIVLSQNEKQNDDYPDIFSPSTDREKYSYTSYDKLGRIVQVGELLTLKNLEGVSGFNDAINDEDFPTNITPHYRYDVTSTVYDDEAGLTVPPPFGTEGQENLRTRVASVFMEEGLMDADINSYSHATHYSYDIHGNVKTLIQDNKLLAADISAEQFKVIKYDYDLISGNVNKISYQDNDVDRFFHKYLYDDDNRLSEVWTSHDDVIWERDARYYYYRHGPLARMELGDLMLQGIDYAYTIQGWLKGVNSSALNSTRDMGNDSKSGSNQYFGSDAFAFVLDYFDGDYSYIKTSATSWLATHTGSAYAGSTANLYNGNIRAMSTALMKYNATAGQPNERLDVIGKSYAYDQLNRIVASKTYIAPAMDETGKFTWSYSTGGDAVVGSDKWKTAYTYDANGNIITHKRCGDAPSGIGGGYDMDDMTYSYYSGTNQLRYVKDVASGSYSVDIDNEESETLVDNTTSDGDPVNDVYSYDAIGNLIRDDAAKLTDIQWNVYGKITQINKYYSSLKPDEPYLKFKYDAMGNRIAKIVLHAPSTSDPDIYTYYVRDPKGGIMTTYERIKGGTDKIYAIEQHIYGSSRLGYTSYPAVDNAKGDMSKTLSTSGFYTRTLGEKRYELVNHLGNVLTVISDRRLTIPISSGSTTVKLYEANVIAAQDYDPFGMLLVGRIWGSEEYRYGFNGKENIDDIYGDDNAVDFGMRIYDPRLGRFLSVDPFEKKQAYESPFTYAGNSPIFCLDVEGLVRVEVHVWHTDRYGVKTETIYVQNITTADDIKGISRTTLHVDWEWVEKPQEEGSILYGWVDNGYSIRENSGETSAEKYKRESPGEYYAWKLSGQFSANTPFGLIGQGLFSDRDWQTDQYLKGTEKNFMVFQGVVDLAMLAFVKSPSSGLKYLFWQFADLTFEENAAYLGGLIGLNSDQQTILAYHLIKFSLEGLQGKIEEVQELIVKSIDTQLKAEEFVSQMSSIGVDLNLPQNNEETAKEAIDISGGN